MGRYKWSLFKRLVSDCHKNKGTLFGGAVRDSYIHDYNARKFCQKYDESQYNDTQITEFPGRFVVPNDIDCIILAENSNNLLETLHSKYYIRKVLNSDASYLSESLQHGHYRFSRYSILELKGDLHVMIQLDMIVQLYGEEIVHPFGDEVDMDVNALWWNKDSIRVNLPYAHSPCSNESESLHDTLVKSVVLENIVSKVATIYSPQCPSRRILKMKKHGWGIKYLYRTIQISNEPYDGLCVLCQDTIVGDHSTFECKCAHICMCCLREHYNALPKCTICKVEVDYDKLKNDVRIYNAIHFDTDDVRQSRQPDEGRPGTVFITLHDMMLQLIQAQSDPSPVD